MKKIYLVKQYHSNKIIKIKKKYKKQILGDGDGIFTGIINEPIIGSDMAPDWRKTEIQKHIQVDDWKIINNPSTKYFKRKTLVEIEENSINKIINF